METPACQELFPSGTGRRASPSSWRHELGHNAPVRGHRNPLACFDSTDIAAQVVFELSDTGLHPANIATCGHSCKLRGRRRQASLSQRGVVVLVFRHDEGDQDVDVEQSAYACRYWPSARRSTSATVRVGAPGRRGKTGTPRSNRTSASATRRRRASTNSSTCWPVLLARSDSRSFSAASTVMVASAMSSLRHDEPPKLDARSVPVTESKMSP